MSGAQSKEGLVDVLASIRRLVAEDRGQAVPAPAGAAPEAAPPGVLVLGPFHASDAPVTPRRPAPRLHLEAEAAPVRPLLLTPALRVFPAAPETPVEAPEAEAEAGFWPDAREESLAQEGAELTAERVDAFLAQSGQLPWLAPREEREEGRVVPFPGEDRRAHEAIFEVLSKLEHAGGPQGITAGFAGDDETPPPFAAFDLEPEAEPSASGAPQSEPAAEPPVAAELPADDSAAEAATDSGSGEALPMAGDVTEPEVEPRGEAGVDYPEVEDLGLVASAEGAVDWEGPVDEAAAPELLEDDHPGPELARTGPAILRPAPPQDWGTERTQPATSAMGDGSAPVAGLNDLLEALLDDADGQAGEVIAALIRNELRGELGERMTRQIRKLVHREIERHLSNRLGPS